MEIERKFLIKKLPDNLESYLHKEYEQGYLSVSPVVRVRKEEDKYFLTYKGSGTFAREEANLPLDKASYEHLRQKCDHNLIHKTRYFIPIENTKLTIELDIFHDDLSPLIVAEVEFDSIEEANAFAPPGWFKMDVTDDPTFQNSNLCRIRYSDISFNE